jgi:hypothetical protein
MATTSSCFKSQSNRPRTCAHSLRAHVPSDDGSPLPARVSFTVAERLGLKPLPRRDRRADQACADVAAQSDSLQGSRRGSSLRSTAPRRLVRVQRLQSYSNAAHAALRCCSRVIQVVHSSFKCSGCCLEADDVLLVFVASWSSSLVVLHLDELKRPRPRRLPTNMPRERSAF